MATPMNSLFVDGQVNHVLHKLDGDNLILFGVVPKEILNSVFGLNWEHLVIDFHFVFPKGDLIFDLPNINFINTCILQDNLPPFLSDNPASFSFSVCSNNSNTPSCRNHENAQI